MEIFDPNNSVPTITEPFPEVKDYLSLDQILPDTTGRSELASFGSPSPILESVPISIGITAGDRLFPGQIPEAIAPHLSPPEPLPPPSPALPDPLIGNSAVVNQEAIASLGQPGNGVKVEYYDRPDLTRRVLTTIVPQIDFNWGDGSPDEAIAPDNFSARWTGKLQPDFTELYTFSIQSNDPVRLWLDGEPIIDNASDPTDISGTIALEAEKLHDLIFEYAHGSGDAAVELSWSSPSQPQQVIPLSAFFTPETRPDSSEDRDPEIVQFFTKAFYNSGETLRFRGQVYAGDTDPDAIDFRLKKDGDEWIDIQDATEFVPNSNNPGYASFNYELSGLEPGRYQLQGSAIASSETSGTATQSFTVLDLGTQLPDNVLLAIARSVNLDNYSPEELAGTQQWIVNLREGESSAEFATEFGARVLGATGHIPHSYIWEFAEDGDPREIASQLSESVAVQFAYPQVSVKLEPLFRSIFFPKDRFFEEQWHLNNTGQRGGEDGVDVNVTGAWDRATGDGVVIGIVDDGLQYTHPDLRDKYRPDLSRDFNEGDIETKNYDGDPAPFSQGLTFDAQLPGSVELEDGDEIIQYVPFEGTVENLKVTLDIDHPSPEELEVYLYSPNGTELELIPGDEGNEYTIDPEKLENESSLGPWTLIIESDTRIPVVLHDWSLILDVWNSHGTPVAGVAAASGNNDLGVTGVAPDAELAGLRLIAADRVTDFQIADALYSELNRGIDIYNNSWKPEAFWSGPESMMALHQGVTDGRGGPGNIYVFGAGNDWGNLENVNYNAFTNSRHTIAVGAIDNRGKKSDYSQQGPSLLVSAPSSNNRVGITTTDLVGPEGRNFNGDGEYGFNYSELDYTNDFGGTSSATPVVSGAIALMLEANPNLTPRDVQHILVDTADRDKITESSRKAKWSGDATDEIRHSDLYGFGVVDAEAAVNAAASWTPVAEEVSFSTGMLTADRKIRDGDWEGVTQTIEISEDIAIEWVEVVLDITHELRSDLIIELTSPDGTTSKLANEWFEDSESDTGYDNFVLTSVRHWGESSQGEWQLQVVDRRSFLSAEAGTWDSWELKFYGTQPTTVEVEATDPNASEDNNPGEFTFTRTGGKLDNPLIVDYSVEGTATAGADYEALTGTVEIPAGESQAIARVIPEDDGLVEGDETVVLNLVPDIYSYGIGTNNSATITIANNPPILTLIDSLTGAREETSFTISYSDLMAKSDAVDADGDPIFLEISTIASGTLTKDNVPVEPGVTTLSAGEAVVWIPDTVGDELSAFTVRAFDAIDYSSTEVPVKVAVAALPTVTISASDANASEDGDAGEWTVTRTGDTTESLEVSFSIAGDATAGTDYSAIDNIIIPAGDSSVKVPLIPIDDEDIEGDETVTVNLETGTGYKLGDDRSSSITIAENDFPNNPPTLTSIETLTDATEETPFTISYAQLRSASNVADADGDAISFQIEAIASGTLQKNDIAVSPGVTTLEEGETVVWTPDTVGDEVTAFTVRAFDGTDYSSAPVQVEVAVIALPIVTISASDANASEDGNAGEWTVTRSGDTTESLEVSFSIAGDATAGTDYETIDNIIIPAGDSSVKIPLVPIDDAEIEGSQTVTVNLETDASYKLPDQSSSSITIADNDFPNNPPTLTSIETLTDATEQTPFTISYGQLRSASNVADADGDAISFQIEAIASGTLQKNDIAVSPGVTTLSEGETVVWTPDTVGSEVSAFTVRAFDGTDYSSAPVQVEVAVIALPIVTISASDANASEDGDAGEWTVTRTGDTTESLEVSFSIAGDATAGTDYSAIDNIIIPAGDSSVKVPLIPIDDEEIEGSQTVTVNLETGTGYKLPDDRSSSITIAENDFPNNPPTLTSIETLTDATEETPFTISYAQLRSASNVADADGDAISFQIEAIASGTLQKNDIAVSPGVTTLEEGETVVWTPDTVGDEVTAFTVRAFDGIDYSSAPVQVEVAVTALPTVTISASDANASEDGDAGEWTVTRSGDTTESLEVSFSIAGDATAGTDYETIDNIIIPAGFSEVKIPLIPIDDEDIEGDETVTVNLETDLGYKLGDDRSAEVIIADNDFAIDLESLALTTVATSLEAGDNFNVRFLAINNGPETAGPFNVAFYLSEDDTITSDDLLLGNYTVSQLIGYRNTGLKSIPLTLPDAGDAFWNGDGDYTLGMWVDSDNVISESDEDNNVNTEVDKDKLTISVGGTQGNEPPIAVDDSANTAAGTTVTIPVLSNDFDPDGDPLAIIGVSTVTSGEVDLSDNNLVYRPNVGFAGEDSFTYTLSDGQGGTDTATVSVTVTALPIVTISGTDANASEDGDAGEWTVTRTGDTTSSLPVSFSIAGDADPGTDYEAIDNIIIPAGSSSVKIPLIPIDDEDIEGSQTATVNLETDTDYKLGDDRSSSITIADNDFPNNPPTLTSIETLTDATEETPFTISYAQLRSASNVVDVDGDPISFQIEAIASGTLQKNDIAVSPGVTTLEEGETVVWTPDTVGDEVSAFTVRAFDGTDYSSAPVQVEVAVTALPTVTISASDANASEDGDAGEWTVTRSGDTTESLEVSFSIAGDADPGTDYEAIDNIIIPAGSSSVKIPLIPIDDEDIEGSQTATVNLETDTGYKLGGDRSAEVIIADNDFAIDLESLALTTVATSLEAGDNFNVRFLAINNGPETAGPFNVAFYLSEDDTITSDDLLLGNYTVSQLIGYRNTGLKSIALTLPDTGDAFWNGDGDYTLGMWVDSDNVISESNEDNNANTEVEKDYLTISISDTQLNQPPVATDDATTITQGSTATIAVLTNDSDPDGDPLAITGVSTPASGEVDLSGNNAVYIPNLGFAGADSFIYTISDGQGGTDTATANVTVEPSQIDLESLALTTAATSLEAGDNFNVRFLAINNGPETAEPFNVAFYLSEDDTITSDDLLLGNYAVSQLIGYRNTGLKSIPLTLPDAGDAFWNGDGDYTLGMWVDSDNVISESDEDNNVNTEVDKDKLTISVGGTQGNEPPIAVDDTTNTAAGTTVTIPVLSNDFDPDGDPLAIIGVSTATSGEVSISDNNLVYTPNLSFAGEDSFTYSLSDSQGGTDTATVNVTVTALPIVTISGTDANASEDGDAGEWTVTRSGDTTSSLPVNFSIAGDADPGTDYESIDNIIIPAGFSEVKIPLIPIDDEEIEGSQTATVNLETGTGYKLGDKSSASVTIADNDSATVYIVTNTNDSGVGSLRNAIVWANDNPGRDTITFDIPGDGPHTISPTSALPDITEGVLIDGWSENGDTPGTTPLIVLDGSLTRDLPGYFNGLTIQGSSVEVRGLVINNWKSSGIRIQGTSATDNWIYGNFIGTTPDGTAAASNGGDGVIIFQGDDNIVGTNGDGIADAAEANLISGNTLSGVDIESDGNIVAGNRIGTNLNGSAAIGNGEGGVDLQGNDNRIGTNGDGTADAVEANLISGNGYSGVKIHANSTDNIVAGNLIGTDRDGTAPIANQHDGVSVSGNGNIIGTDGDGTADAAEVNLISGNKDHGVEISGGNDNVVAGNLIGTNGDGTAAIANTRSGVYIIVGDNNIIGTDGDGQADAAEVNLISGNTGYGVFITSGNSNVLAGNRIGTNLEGTGAIGNGRDGVLISDDNNIVGTDGDGTADAAEANLISGNQRYGVYLLSNDNRVAGNFIGTNIDGRSAIGNRRDGVNVVGDKNIIGGTEAGLGNVIAFNSGDGVRVNTSTGNSIPGNSIFSNIKRGINSDDEPTLPELTSATSDDASTAIVGTFNSIANSNFTLEFFSNSVLDESGYGEGQTFLGSQEVTTGSDGNASFTANFSSAVPVGHFMTATATDPDGNTSEFSLGVEVQETPLPIDLEGFTLFTAGGTSFTAGDNLNVGFLVTNNEREEAGSFNVAFYLSGDGIITKGDLLLGNYEISRLAGNTNTGLLFANVTLPNAGDLFWSSDGFYTLGMITDSDDAISESNEDNNANIGAFKDYVTISVGGTQLNKPPIAVDDSANTAAGTTVTIPVLSNDFDPDGDPLAIIGVSTATSGEVDLSDNNLVYRPNVSFAGEDSFTYTVSDGQGGTDTATVSVTVEQPSSARVTVTVNRVNEIDDMDVGFFGGSDDADFFTELTINGRTWQSPIEKNQNRITPNWQFSQEVSDFTVPITINMYEEDGGFFGGINHVDINRSGGVKQLNLLYDLRTGKISGDASGTRGEQIYVRGSGDSLRAEMWFTIGSDILLVQPNTAPTVPNGLHEVVNGNSVTLNWNRATDAETAPADLTYNLRVGTTPSGENIMSPTSISPQLAQNGNVDRNNSWTLNNLEPGTYYWTVQAVDSAFAGSEFAPSGSFTVEPSPSGRVTVTVHRAKDVDGIDDISNFFTGSEADYFTRISINGQSWQSPQIKDEEDIRPNWQFSQNVTAFTVPIVINLLDSDPFTDQQADINPLLGKEQLELTYNLLTGEIGGSGVSGTRAQQIYVHGQGGDERAEIWFTIDSTFSEDSISTNHWNAAFINRTNSNVDDRALYNFSNPEAVLDLGPASGDRKIRLYQNWNASPASGVQSDYFAMQAWTRTNFAADKLYKITTKSDDGSWFRLQNVNTGAWTGNSVVEGDDGADWRDRAIWNSPKTIMFKVPETGEYDFYAEFYDRAGEAVVDFTVEEVEFFSESVNESQQWQGQFFWWDRQEGNQPPTDIFAAGGDPNNAIAVVNLGNNTRNDGNKGLSFNWADGLPNNDARLPNENFAILATTETYLEAGRKYQARVRGDDGFQLLAQNQNSNELVYITPENNWAQSYGDHQEIDFTVPSDGQYDLQVQFYEERGDANFDLSWEPVNFTGRTIATTNTNVRSGPSRDFAIVDKLTNGTEVTFDKWTEGEFISYPSLGTASSLWYRIAGTNRWISAAIIDGSP